MVPPGGCHGERSDGLRSPTEVRNLGGSHGWSVSSHVPAGRHRGRRRRGRAGRPVPGVPGPGGAQRRRPLDVLGPVTGRARSAAMVRLWLPAGFQYRSFHDTEFPVTLSDGTALPGRHDGMAAFPGPNGNVILVRNHEVNGPRPAFGPGTPYDADGRRRHDDDRGRPVRRGRRVLHQPQRHPDELCRRPHAVGKLDHVRGDRQRPRRRAGLHRRLQRPAASSVTGSSSRSRGQPAPVRTASRSRRRGASPTNRSPSTRSSGILYLTEDNFGFPSGFYRYIPTHQPDAQRASRQRGPAADAGRRGQAQRRPGRLATASGHRTR